MKSSNFKMQNDQPDADCSSLPSPETRGWRLGAERNAEFGVRGAEQIPHSPFLIPHFALSSLPTRGERRGVLLLVVLSLLVMFVLMALTYVLVATKHLSATRQAGRIGQAADPPADLLHGAALQILSGSTLTTSAIGPHSVLEDRYGYASISSTIRSVTTAANGQILELTFPSGSGPTQPEGALEGRILTITSGVARGMSTRIVRHELAGSDHLISILAFKRNGVTIIPESGAELIINGREFSGTGFGYDSSAPPANGVLTLKNGTREVALLPNPVFNQTLASPNDKGGAHEDFDIADYQNVHLALMDVNGNVILPSFHRPDLMKYWWLRQRTDPNINLPNWDWTHIDTADPEKDGPTLLRQVMLRPSPLDHFNDTNNDGRLDTSEEPTFTGSNPYLSTKADFLANIYGAAGGGVANAWDVDNNGDGIPDSVWIDIGQRVFSTPDGRLYKPLFAFLIVDLDGRINLNAHGNTDQLTNLRSQDIAAGQMSLAGTNGMQPVRLPFGLGTGPADVVLSYRDSSGNDVPFTTTEATRLMRGFSRYTGRYGETIGASAQAGKTGEYSQLGLVKRFAFPDNSFNPIANPPVYLPLSAFGSPPDLWGRMAVGLDFLGQPLFYKRSLTGQTGWVGEMQNTPYDLNLSRNGPRPGQATDVNAADNPFTVAELERVLRRYDLDAYMLPDRLTALAPTLATDLTKQYLVTTDSWDSPSPSMIGPRGVRTAGTVPTSLPQMLAAKMGGSATPEAIRNLISWDLLAGKRMNINRPLGDGTDNSLNTEIGYGVVDEPLPTIRQIVDARLAGQPPQGEAVTEMTAATPRGWSEAGIAAMGVATGYNPTAFNLTNGLNVNFSDTTLDVPARVDEKDQVLARSLMARHLYMLARLTMDDDYLTNGDNVKWFSESGLNADQKRELAIRRIAQWAVNVVDAMDPDNICTAFEYDVNPWNGWNVDGIVDDGTNQLSRDDGHADRRLVWGSEAPALLLMETLAFHDRRVADTDKDPSDKDRGDPDDNPNDVDNDLDQVRLPEGTLFFELMATHNANNTVQSADLYSRQSNGRWCLDLGRMAPAGNDGTSNNMAYPVWRLAITKPHVGNNATPSPRNFVSSAPGLVDSASFEPEQRVQDTSNFSLLPSGGAGAASNGQNVELERFVWLAGAQPTNHYDAAGTNSCIYYARQYFNPFASNAGESTYLPAGGYAVVGPREVTHIGSKTPTGSQKWGTPSDHRITLNPVNIFGANNASNYPTSQQVQPVVGIVCAADAPAGWPIAGGIGMSVSEPLPSNYYLAPTDNNPETNVRDAYGDLTGGGDSTFLDEPLDIKTGNPLELLPNRTRTETTMNYRTVFLQRLANPLAPYHPVTNPYLSVDWMPIDLTVFNGEDRVSGDWDTAQNRPNWDPHDNNPDAADLHFASRQRGMYSSHGAGNTSYNIWSIWPDPSRGGAQLNLGGEDPRESTADNNLSTVHFRHQLNPQAGATGANGNSTTLGYLNHSYGEPWSKSHSPAAPDAYVGAAFGVDPSNPGGTPEAQPFPWITWNNRPYANLAELLLVPATSSGRLTLEFSTRIPGDSYEADNAANHRMPFNHLLNFYNSGAPSAPGASYTPGESASLINMLEYLEVPSPFVGNDTVLNPTTFGWGGGAVGTETAGTTGLHTPFNMVSNYRVPGKVNINTIMDARVWNSLLGGDPSGASPQVRGPTFDDIVNSRQGDGRTPYTFDGTRPSIFSRPFRTAAGADLVPLVGPDLDLRQAPAEATLYREGVFAGGTHTGLPLLAGPPPGTETAYNNTTRNPYFATESLGRLTNQLTTRSNVYAVWITVGYFEVTPDTTGNRTVYPDGYKLGQELGADTGEIERHRAFYIIDRSIPVGFERGKNHNVEDCILLRRYIE